MNHIKIKIFIFDKTNLSDRMLRSLSNEIKEENNVKIRKEK